MLVHSTNCCVLVLPTTTLSVSGLMCLLCAIGGTQRLPKLVGAGKAKEMIFTAKVVSGQEAHDIGLVEQVVPANEDCNAAYLKALEIAKEIGTKVLQSM